ncbi:MAG: hypothetical protein ABSH41_29100 [Syntrophobacteraceae bacterium]|jgi:hypothetical protein
MPHDRNGKLVEVGDVVKGMGYRHEVIGPVLSITAGCSSCDMQVAVIEVLPAECQAFGRLFSANGKSLVILPSINTVTAKDFEIIQKADGTDAV